MVKITAIKVIAIFDNGDFVEGIIDPNEEFVADLYSTIRVKGTEGIMDAMRFLLNYGSKAITGVNPVDYINRIRKHFGDTRNINEMKNMGEIIRYEKSKR